MARKMKGKNAMPLKTKGKDAMPCKKKVKATNRTFVSHKYTADFKLAWLSCRAGLDYHIVPKDDPKRQNVTNEGKIA